MCDIAINLKLLQELFKSFAHDENRVVIYLAQISNIAIYWPWREDIAIYIALHFTSLQYWKVLFWRALTTLEMSTLRICFSAKADGWNDWPSRSNEWGLNLGCLPWLQQSTGRYTWLHNNYRSLAQFVIPFILINIVFMKMNGTRAFVSVVTIWRNFAMPHSKASLASFASFLSVRIVKQEPPNPHRLNSLATVHFSKRTYRNTSFR